MSTRTSPWPPGVPCWTDCSTADVGAARSFYEAVLGWSFRETGEEYSGYLIAEVRGVASDPAGGVFGVWSAREHIGASLVNEPGALTWEDLRSTDPDAARAFYGRVFGYDFQALEAAGPDYTTIHLPGDPAPLGGMGGMFGAPEGTPSHWLVYFNVADADAAAGAASGNGGQALAPPFDTPFGRMAPLVDPAGAVFWIARTNPEQPMPDRSG